MTETTIDDRFVALSGGEGRERRLLGGVSSLKRRANLLFDGERVLFVLGALLAPLGFLLIMVAWYGAADSGDVFEQIPFLISGGIGGLGLMIVGGFLYNAWWLTRQIREARAQHRDLMDRHQDLARSNEMLAQRLESLVAAVECQTDSGAAPRRRSPLRAE